MIDVDLRIRTWIGVGIGIDTLVLRRVIPDYPSRQEGGLTMIGRLVIQTLGILEGGVIGVENENETGMEDGDLEAEVGVSLMATDKA